MHHHCRGPTLLYEGTQGGGVLATQLIRHRTGDGAKSKKIKLKEPSNNIARRGGTERFEQSSELSTGVS